jgi:hypothetical protein
MSPTPLWVTLPGAPAWLALLWSVWLLAVALGAGLSSAWLGPAGTIVVVLAIGWALARRALSPLAQWRRYHLDDDEITLMGPGRRVRRIPWFQIETLTQTRAALRLHAGPTQLDLPLGALLASGALGAALARMIPGLAARLWVMIDDAEDVRLVAPLDPPTAMLGWWAYVPACVACLVAAGAEGFGLVLVLAAGERLLAFARGRFSAVRLWRTGVTMRAGLRRLFVAWPQAEVTRGPHGLVVSAGHAAAGIVPRTLVNFWVAAPVIELKAQLGVAPGATVHFRVRVTQGRLAVVGEIEPQA